MWDTSPQTWSHVSFTGRHDTWACRAAGSSLEPVTDRIAPVLTPLPVIHTHPPCWPRLTPLARSTLEPSERHEVISADVDLSAEESQPPCGSSATTCPCYPDPTCPLTCLLQWPPWSTPVPSICPHHHASRCGVGNAAVLLSLRQHCPPVLSQSHAPSRLPSPVAPFHSCPFHVPPPSCQQLWG